VDEISAADARKCEVCDVGSREAPITAPRRADFLLYASIRDIV
jgi:hypothetical protein